ncbi:D-alanine--D-alanine ligase [Kerstersia gyiorum]|uniref:D-alanine--D-alanine ligase n=1 Tax=Kerstersia gyiorum TaxID=206506 RepID=A0A171KP70_9BURK|nr:D-alanine--D-alanine ligase [Kerstersia gyiorum]MCO7637859.1 D-alanine--D-alanine ligase [Pseudomonas sp. S 311-6]KAB0542338.1 D-alanine--D-alanine ligase [Kerstersia gyiorum]KKO70687.1 D-alanine--D-alanine ligase [Kerstersia gyiorum]MCP1634058.1 D-alanine-D-alanine ligase [Kerstersia gyiorum]MCP1637281.1 D-alanine-D-alanine ligase [Kerstersia gyiorum]
MSMEFGKVGVLYGGRSAEREVSLMSGQGVYDALRSRGVDAHLFDTGKHTLAELAHAGFDRVFIALHGRYGEDGTLQGALELLGIPYTGSGTLASALAMDKVMTKRIWVNEGLPTPLYAELDDDSDLDAVVAELGLPIFVKPPHEGSTLGVTKVEHASHLPAAVQLASRYEEKALAEKFVDGRELTVAVLGSGAQARALPVIEIRAPQGNYDFQNKYYSDETQYICPADLPNALTAEIRSLAERAFRVLGCEGWGRVDVMLDRQDRPWLLEINTSPGMTGHSLVPMAARAEGIDYAELCVRILAGASLKVHGHRQA